MKDYIKVLLSDIKRNIKDYENQIEILEIKIETSQIFVEKLEKALKQPIDKSDYIGKIKEVIKELEYDDNLDIPRLTTDDVIGKLKDIIK